MAPPVGKKPIHQKNTLVKNIQPLVAPARNEFFLTLQIQEKVAMKKNRKCGPAVLLYVTIKLVTCVLVVDHTRWRIITAVH